ncbi:MAG: hypothetical protein NBV63_02915 [Candidatus Pacebacteria bacterium]|nr:hypothetical protein [Candidatus Paceibacterota bacterium]
MDGHPGFQLGLGAFLATWIGGMAGVAFNEYILESDSWFEHGIAGLTGAAFGYGLYRVAFKDAYGVLK